MFRTSEGFASCRRRRFGDNAGGAAFASCELRPTKPSLDSDAHNRLVRDAAELGAAVLFLHGLRAR